MTFEEQIVSSRDYIYTLTLHYVKDINDREDLCSETILRALKSKQHFQEGTYLKSWLFVLVKNIYINEYRRKTKSPIQLVERFDEVEEVDFFQDSKLANDYEFVDRIDNQQMIDQFYKVVPEQLLTPTKLHAEGWSYHEIAKKLSVPLGTIKSRIHFGRQCFLTQLRKEKENSEEDLQNIAKRFIRETHIFKRNPSPRKLVQNTKKEHTVQGVKKPTNIVNLDIIIGLLLMETKLELTDEQREKLTLLFQGELDLTNHQIKELTEKKKKLENNLFELLRKPKPIEFKKR